MNHFISLDQAIQMTTTFRQNRDTILNGPYQGAEFLPNSETFDRDAFDQVLSEEGCKKLRIYYGMDNELKVHAIIVGVNADNNDILPATDTTSMGGDDTRIIEVGQRCPPECTISPLNP